MGAAFHAAGELWEIDENLCRSELTIFRAVLGVDIIVERVDHILAGARRCAYRVSKLQRG